MAPSPVMHKSHSNIPRRSSHQHLILLGLRLFWSTATPWTRVSLLFHISLIKTVLAIDVSLLVVHATWVTELGTLVKPSASQSQDEIRDGKRFGAMGSGDWTNLCWYSGNACDWEGLEWRGGQSLTMQARRHHFHVQLYDFRDTAQSLGPTSTH